MMDVSTFHSPLWLEWQSCHDPDLERELFELIADQPAGHTGARILTHRRAMCGGAFGVVIALWNTTLLLASGWRFNDVVLAAAAVILALFYIGLCSGTGTLLETLDSPSATWREVIRPWPRPPRRVAVPVTDNWVMCLSLLLALAAGLAWQIALDAGSPTHVANRQLVRTAVALSTTATLLFLGFWIWLRSGYQEFQGTLVAGRPSLRRTTETIRQWAACTTGTNELVPAPAAAAALRTTWHDLLARLDVESSEPGDIDAAFGRLVSGDWRERFLARSAMLRLGTESLPCLGELLHALTLQEQYVNSGGELSKPDLGRLAAVVETPDRPVLNSIDRLITEIARSSWEAFAPSSSWLCRRCLVRAATHRLNVAGRECHPYHACRSCHSTSCLERCDDWIVAVLDSAMREPASWGGGRLAVNWRLRPRPFDFQSVHIRRADDRAVEQMIIALRNDGDACRGGEYRDMACVIHPDCELGRNTLSQLRQFFGRIRFQKTAGA